MFVLRAMEAPSSRSLLAMVSIGEGEKKLLAQKEGRPPEIQITLRSLIVVRVE